MTNKVVRVLAIKQGETKDKKGRGIGDDWLLCTMGLDSEDDHEYHVTTDCVHGSDLPYLETYLPIRPRDLARAVARALNHQWREVIKRKKQEAKGHAKPE
jgi:hypothetical protein